ncbi:DNA metabolism protein [Yersinia enterocolitica]|nr:DNA metabolism protein [Yersinia enterocolitica]EKN5970822.1 DNA metabolism protein [Yersinia enterocolitica]EKN6018874.1 DNA metabolism protein [Yersinia enterocolitica]EKN6035670.1 DNA metabolism protein [Yersinia enterocolitica]EKN6061805.1 DNA metabolism protein [Yersinia enterocolitica]
MINRRLLRFAIQGLRSARRRHVLRVRSVGCALCAPRLALLATPCWG